MRVVTSDINGSEVYFDQHCEGVNQGGLSVDVINEYSGTYFPFLSLSLIRCLFSSMNE